jgi:hypothetical protein
LGDILESTAPGSARIAPLSSEDVTRTGRPGADLLDVRAPTGGAAPVE